MEPPASSTVAKAKGGSEAQRRFEKIYNPKTGTTKGYKTDESTLANTADFTVCRKKTQEYILFDIAHEKQRNRSKDGKAWFRAIFFGSREACLAKFAEIKRDFPDRLIHCDIIPTCMPFPITQNAYKDEIDPKTFKVIKKDMEGR